MDNNLNQQQTDSLNEALKRGEAFSFMVATDGWKLVQDYFQARVQAFTNGLLTSDTDISAFERERLEISGIRKLLGFVQHNIDEFRKER